MLHFEPFLRSRHSMVVFSTSDHFHRSQASAAAEQWGLDMEGLELWARRRQLPGVGVADLLDYRQEHPEATWTKRGAGRMGGKTAVIVIWVTMSNQHKYW